jgi:ABC-type branched-subunit amino acid transport system ATPase component
MNASEVIIAFENVSAGYGKTRVFQSLSFLLAAGQGVCFIGPNGCGKSTVLRCVLGLAELFEGRIELAGTSVGHIRRSDFARRGVAYVPQGRGDLPSLTVDENVRLAAICGPSPSRSDTSRLVFERLPFLAPLRSQRVANLSGGERTLVALARALALLPRLRLLLLDEISAGLSAGNATAVQALLAQLRKDGVSIMIAEQNLSFAQGLGIPFMDVAWTTDRVDDVAATGWRDHA